VGVGDFGADRERPHQADVGGSQLALATIGDCEPVQLDRFSMPIASHATTFHFALTLADPATPLLLVLRQRPKHASSRCAREFRARRPGCPGKGPQPDTEESNKQSQPRGK
jgi:hypothetical protein